VGEGVLEAGGELCAEDEAGEVERAAGCVVLQALRHPAVPAARASRKSRRCMGGTFSKMDFQSIEHMLRRQERRSEWVACYSGAQENG
jgi:hypothetical protein